MEAQGRAAIVPVALRLVPGPTPLTVDGVREHVAARLDHLGWWDLRLEPRRGGLRFPELTPDPALDLGYHVRHHVLGRAGAPDTVDELIATLAVRPLHREHPLWQLHLVDGAGDGGQTLIWLLHHAMGDGIAIGTILGQLCDHAAPYLDVDHDPVEVRSPPVLDQTEPQRWRHLPTLVRDTRRGLRAVADRASVSAVSVPAATATAPVTSLTATSTQRQVVRTSLTFADLQRIRDAAGVPFADVLTGIVAGVLRHLLDARDEQPAAPLVVNIPTVTADAAAPRLSGNRFANYLTSLATDVDDPWERLAQIAAGSAEARVRLGLFGEDTVARWLDLARPIVAEPVARRAGGRSGRGKATAGTAGANVLVSNVPGTRARWTFDTAEVDAVHIFGPLTTGEALNVTTWRYGPELCVAMTFDPTAITNGHELVTALHASVRALLDRAATAAPTEASTATPSPDAVTDDEAT